MVITACLPQTDEIELKALPAAQERCPHPDVADAVRARTQAIIEHWRDETVFMKPDLYAKAREEFENEIDNILKVMADALETDEVDQWQLLADTAPIHGFHRFEHEFTLGSLLSEYRILRRAIVAQVEDHIGRRCSSEESKSLHTAIDFMVRQGVLAMAARQKELLVRASESKLKYASFVAHDLNNFFFYLASLITSLEHELGNKPALQEAVARLAQAHDALQQIQLGTQRMVDHDRLRQSGSEPKIARVNLREAVVKLTNVMQGAAEAKGIGFDVAIDPAAFAQTDPDLLAIVLQNLIGNAVKHGTAPKSKGKAMVRIAAELIDGPGLLECEHKSAHCGPVWNVSVQDRGCGMTQQQKRAIENMFKRGEQTAAPGRGLGMSIIAEGIRLLQTNLKIESKEGDGSNFTFSVPHVDALKPAVSHSK